MVAFFPVNYFLPNLHSRHDFLFRRLFFWFMDTLFS